MLQELIMFALSALLGLICFGSAAAVAVNAETLDMDKIFALIGAALLGLIFFAAAAWTLFNTRLRDLWKPEAASGKAAEAPAKKEGTPEAVGKSAS